MYQSAIWLVSPFNKKAQLWVRGRKNIFQDLENQLQLLPIDNGQLIWFHCASLGEFEQGRPVIEAFRQRFPTYKILLTFFSPSGYEVRKNYTGADLIYYLPADTPTNARRFVALVKPTMAFFVKYEFWYYYLQTLHEAKIPVISISAIFRPNQLFFKSYGGFYRSLLAYFSHIFVQNQQSFNLLKGIDIQPISLAGDTRFDRVSQIVQAVRAFPIVQAFKNEHKILMVGSAWEEDFEVIFASPMATIKYIIAPHEIHEEQIVAWQRQLKMKSVRYSEANDENLKDAEVLIIDNVGMLSSLYQYAEFAWIGGAFGKGLHNILEAATFGMPLFFGNKNYQKFQEANDLIAAGSAFAVADVAEFEQIFLKLLQNEALYLETANISRAYVQAHIGATEKIINFCTILLAAKQ